MHDAGSSLVSSPWLAPAWQADAHAWIARQLRRRGLQRSGPIEQPHIRPWSTVLTVPTGDHRLYFKATAPSMANDAQICGVLSRQATDLMLSPLAVSRRRRWMLLPDGGPRLREALSGDAALAVWERLLPRYAELQGRLAASPELARLDALEWRTDALATHLEALVGRWAGPAERDAWQPFLPRFAARCAELSELPIPDSLQHDDLHDGNVLLDAGLPRIIDWGDASLAHPFGTLGVTLRSIADRAQIRVSDPRVRRIRDAYLEPWSAIASQRQLRRALRLVLGVWPVARTLTWEAALRQVSPDEPVWNASIVRQQLRACLAAERRRSRR